MSNMIKAIDDDIDSYLALCKHFGEKPEYFRTSQGCSVADCYGKHAGKLEKRAREERN